jgi:imidazole glycerol-phosphate synthase subunit HisF
VRFRDHEVAGDILELAARYRAQLADELIFYDITASPEGRGVERRWVQGVAKLLDIPFCVGGGIKSVHDAEALLNSGADKISVNSPALERPELVDELAHRFGSQCVVVGIDGRHTAQGYRAWQWSGDPRRARDSGRRVDEWLREVQARGAGEIVLNGMEQDGCRAGFDLPQLRALRAICQVPLVASGGAGELGHFIRVFTETGVDAALAAGVFHSGALNIVAVKRALQERDVPVRLPHRSGSESAS